MKLFRVEFSFNKYSKATERVRLHTHAQYTSGKEIPVMTQACCVF